MVTLTVVVLRPFLPLTVSRHVAFFFGAITLVRRALSLHPPEME